MSYILDALRRADAEREGGEIPTLHSRPAPFDTSEVEAGLGAKPWVWIAAGGAVGVLVPLVSYLLLREPPPTPLGAPSAAIQTPAVPAPVPEAAAPITTQSPAPPPVAAIRAPAAAAPAPRSAHRVAAPKAAAAAASPKHEAARSVEPSAPHILAYDQLPPDVRQGLPSLAITGNMYSDVPANRMVIINGQLFREKDEVAAGLTLEEIRRKSVVLRYRSYRFELSS
jgi:general secretion pathway protein B